MADKDESSLQKEYEQRFGEIKEYRNSVWKILCKDYFSKFISSNDRLLDVGAGWGEFINNIEATEKYAMDLNPDTGSHLSPNITFLHQDTSAAWPIDTGYFDVIFTSNFFEHLSQTDDIEKTLAEAHRCLKKNGIIICMGPNIKYLEREYWVFEDHKIPISESIMAELLSKNNFTIELSRARFLPYSMSTGRTPPLFLVRMYLHLPFFWIFFGKQFLVLGRKT